eukprot:TRINITY_DN25395_c0_g1_i1.p1 TRINITY_DN25395_c0_g1~~TRINITY_DN25395_c0_g1_i1.p1  ORF type:complete len:278 (+),score=17.97 TRINITY_DN25395_c0_g1_i1:86-919(+)
MENVIKVGITGGGGRIATVLRGPLRTKGFAIKLFTYVPPGETPLVPIPSEFESASVNFSDAKQVQGAFEGLDVVVHLAAVARDVTAYGDWKEQWENNFEATRNVYQECARAKVRRIVFASSCHVQHGLVVLDKSRTESMDRSKLNGRLMELNDVAFPDSMYAVAKLFGEDLGKLYALHNGLECVALRIGWLYDHLTDDPSQLKGSSAEGFMRSLYLSHRDCINFFIKAIEVKIKQDNGIPFMLAYVCSNNSSAVWNLEETSKNLEYMPQDNAETFFK